MLITDKDWIGKNEIYTDFYMCPKCDDNSIIEGFKYCPNCGENIEWEEQK